MIKFTAQTHIGLVRPSNQDSMLTWQDETTALFMICDGIGGSKAGDKASKETIRLFKEAMECHPDFDDKEEMRLWFDKNLQQINHHIFDLARRNFQYDGMGTTLIGFLKHHEFLLAFNVGDSRLYKYLDSSLTVLSHDQTYAYQMYLRDELTLEETQTHPKRNLLLNAVGIRPNIDYEIIDDFGTYNYLLLCSDGLHGYVDEENIKSCFKSNSLYKIRDCLLENALQAGGLDNISIIILVGECNG